MSNTKLSGYAFILSLGAFALTSFAQPASAQQPAAPVELQAGAETEAEVCVDETLLEDAEAREGAAADLQCQIQCQRAYSCQWWDQACWDALHACLAACD